MFDHIGLRVENLGRSVEFYEAALAPLGYVLCSRDDASAGFGPPGEPALWLYASKDPRTPVHIALRARARGGVAEFHAAALAAGGTSNGPAGLRADYGPRYYAAFVLDPDGNNLEAVCMS